MQEDPARTIKFGWFMIAMGVPGREQVPLLVEEEPEVLPVVARHFDSIWVQDHFYAFRDPSDPKITVQFLEGFRQLCVWGLVIHHLHRDFSLSTRGFALADRIKRNDVKLWLEKATEFGLHD